MSSIDIYFDTYLYPYMLFQMTIVDRHPHHHHMYNKIADMCLTYRYQDDTRHQGEYRPDQMKNTVYMYY
jgi:hypothetical protein